ncbi:MAG: PaaI family thioesterase [Candidatus Rokuibacteriota bacterium]
MTTTDALLRRNLEDHGDELILTVDPAFQGLPETAHGGSVLAAFHLLAEGPGPHQVSGFYRKRVPLGVPLRLITAKADGALACRLLDGSSATLVEGRLGVPPSDHPRPLAPPPATRQPLPVSTTCFACGVDNVLGLRVQLGHDDTVVAGVWRPRDTFRAVDGTLAPVALTTLLDEAAFWLGALASGESGMTTELTVTLHRSIPFGAPIVVAGARSHTRARDDDRFWETAVTASDVSGHLVASGRITFVAVRGAARRLVTGLLALNSGDILRRVFPAYTR